MHLSFANNYLSYPSLLELLHVMLTLFQEKKNFKFERLKYTLILSLRETLVNKKQCIIMLFFCHHDDSKHNFTEQKER
jgi:hypothetical protein